jgi:hypothetical protein
VSSGGSDDVEAILPRLSAAECLRYTLALDPGVALLEMCYPNKQDAAFDTVRSFRPLAAEELMVLRR